MSQQTGVKVRVKVKDSAAVVVGGASGMGRATRDAAIRLDAGQRFAPK